MQRAWIVVPFLAVATASAQAPPSATMKQLMLDLIHPASNEVLLIIYRGGPQNDKDWATVRRGALTLAEAGNLLAARRSEPGDWAKDAKLLADAGAAAYKAAQAKDAKALAAVAEPLDRSCTTCHQQYRPNVFPREGGSR
jgi:mono/diheme cytochrome c family protein